MSMPAKFVEDSFSLLKDYCRKESFRGYDPYDGLNSKFFRISGLNKIRPARLVWIQLFKRFPLNLRRLFFVPRGYNPKALGLFVRSYLNLYKTFGRSRDKDEALRLADLLFSLRSPKSSRAAWGYNFDWQSRTFFVPRHTPNVIVSTFCGHAFCDLYEATGEDRFLKIAVSVADFILRDLNRTYIKEEFCFSYTPLDSSRIYNAGMLAAAYLARIYSFGGSIYLLEAAAQSMNFCVGAQRADGSWTYGADPNQKWVDSFHTAYNLEAIYDYQRYSQDTSFEGNFNRGVDYYRDNFFTSSGVPKFYHDRIYPIDIHAPASFLVLISKARLLAQCPDLAEKVLIWTIRNMQDKIGYFYYQVHPVYKIKIPYMRWACAWMFYAFSCYFRALSDD